MGKVSLCRHNRMKDVPEIRAAIYMKGHNACEPVLQTVFKAIGWWEGVELGVTGCTVAIAPCTLRLCWSP